jgi:hypothetical protein
VLLPDELDQFLQERFRRAAQLTDAEPEVSGGARNVWPVSIEDPFEKNVIIGVIVREGEVREGPITQQIMRRDGSDEILKLEAGGRREQQVGMHRLHGDSVPLEDDLEETQGG